MASDILVEVETDRSEGLETSPPALQKILPVVAVLGVLAFLGYTLTEGSSNSRFIQVGMTLGLLVYLATFVDVVLGLAFLILCIGLSPELSLGGMNDLRLEDFIIPALLLAWLTRTLRGREPVAHVPFKGPAIIYFATLVFSSILGLSAGTTQLSAALPLIAKSIEYYLILLIVANNIRTESEFKALVVFSVLVAMAGSIFGADRAFADLAPDPTNRMQGPLGETATIFGGYLALTLSIVVGLFLHCRTQGQRVLAGTAIVTLSAAILYTYSRTSYAALTVGLIVFGFLKERRLLIIILLLAVLLPILAPESIIARFSTIGDVATGPGPSSWVARVEAWQWAVARMNGTDFLWGKGAGSVRLGDVDNEYVRVVVDTGLLGLAIFLWMLARIGRSANDLYKSLDSETFSKGYAAGYLIAFFTLVVHAIAATSFTSIRTMECFMLMTGFTLCLAHHREAWHLGDLQKPLDRDPIFLPAIEPPRRTS